MKTTRFFTLLILGLLLLPADGLLADNGRNKAGKDEGPPKLSKEEQIANLYDQGLIQVYFDEKGKLKKLAAMSQDELDKKKEVISASYEKKLAQYDKNKGKFETKYPDRKYDRFPPQKPSFRKAVADIEWNEKHTKLIKLAPKENYYGLYRVEFNGKISYETNYDFGDAMTQSKEQKKYITSYNTWIKKKKKGEEPKPPKIKKLGEGMTSAEAKKFQGLMKAYDKKNASWKKNGSKEGKEPQRPDLEKFAPVEAETKDLSDEKKEDDKIGDTLGESLGESRTEGDAKKKEGEDNAEGGRSAE